MLSRMRKAKTDQRKLDIAVLADANEGIRQGLEDLEKGQGRPVEEFFKEFEASHKVPK